MDASATDKNGNLFWVGIRAPFWDVLLVLSKWIITPILVSCKSCKEVNHNTYEL